MTASPHDQMRGHGAMLVFSALVAGSFSLGTQIANDIAPIVLNAVRFWLAAVLVGAVLLMRGVSLRPLLRQPWRYGVLGGLFTLYFVLMFEGLKTAAPVSMAAVFTLTPILTAGFGWLLLRQVLTPRIALALSIGAAGAVWVIFRADLAALAQFSIGRGERIYFIGCIAHALYIPLVRVLARGEGSGLSALGTLLAGGALLSIAGAGPLAATDWAALPPLVWWVLAYVTVFASAASIALLQYASLCLPGAKVMAYTYLTPAWVIVWEVAQGNPAPPPLVVGGVVLALVALGLLLKPDAVRS
jgi:drug/metabolite transporter (DMT)-like permease